MKRNGFQHESTGDTFYGLTWKQLVELKKDVDAGYERFWKKRGGVPYKTGSFVFSPNYKNEFNDENNLKF